VELLSMLLSLFKDKKALELDKLDVEVVGRKTEADRLRSILSGFRTGLLPKLIGIHGPPGSGKTLVARTMCTEFEQGSSSRLRFIYVNLGEAKTVFGCANRLLVSMGGRWKAGRFGLDGIMEEFWTRLLEWKDGEGRYMVICFDEADRLFLDRRGDPSGFMYRLVRSQDRLAGSGIGISLITISNTPFWDIWDLDGRVRSSMGVEEIFFQPYSRQDMKQILMGRCDEAFEPGVVDEKVIEACVDYTAEQSRDVRRMVDLLRICAEIAEAKGDKKVEMKHYTEAQQRVEMDHYKPLLNSVAELQRFLLIALAWLYEIENVIAPSTNQLYTELNRFLEEAKSVVPSYRRVSGVLKEMEVTNLIGVRDVSRGRGGRSNEVWLKIPAHTVLENARIDWRKAKKLHDVKKEIEDLRRRFDKRRRG
jgi:cell division control protein 6